MPQCWLNKSFNVPMISQRQQNSSWWRTIRINQIRWNIFELILRIYGFRTISCRDKCICVRCRRNSAVIEFPLSSGSRILIAYSVLKDQARAMFSPCRQAGSSTYSYRSVTRSKRRPRILAVCSFLRFGDPRHTSSLFMHLSCRSFDLRPNRVACVHRCCSSIISCIYSHGLGLSSDSCLYVEQKE